MDCNFSEPVLTPLKQKTIPVVNRSETIAVKACGKTLQLDMQCANSLLSLQATLQQELQIEAMLFCFFDVNGMALHSDEQLHDSVAKARMPLSAVMTYTGILELCQKQWMQTWAQMTVASGEMMGKMNELSRQVYDTRAQMQQLQQQSTNLVESIRREALEAVECVEKQMEEMRVSLDIDCNDVRCFMEKTETSQKIADTFQDRHASAHETSESFRTRVLDAVPQIHKMRAELSTTSQKVSARLREVEEGFATLQDRIFLLSSRQASSHVGLAERHECLSQEVESLKLKEKQKQNQIEASLHHLNALEVSVVEIHQMIVREREEHQEQGDKILRSHADLYAEHQTRMKALQRQIAACFKQQSEEQARTGQGVAEVPVKSPDTIMRSSRSTDTPVSSPSSMSARGIRSVDTPVSSPSSMSARLKQEAKEQERKGQGVTEVPVKSPDTIMRSIRSTDTPVSSPSSMSARGIRSTDTPVPSISSMSARLKQEAKEQERKGQGVAEVPVKSPDTIMRSIRSTDTPVPSISSMSARLKQEAEEQERKGQGVAEVPVKSPATVMRSVSSLSPSIQPIAVKTQTQIAPAQRLAFRCQPTSIEVRGQQAQPDLSRCATPRVPNRTNAS